MFSALVSVCNEVALGTKRLLSLMTLWIGEEGVEKKTQNSRNGGCWNPSPAITARLQRSAHRQVPQATALPLSPDVYFSPCDSGSSLELCAFVQVTARRDRAVTVSSRMASDVGRSTWGQPLTQRTVYSAFRSSWEVPA